MIGVPGYRYIRDAYRRDKPEAEYRESNEDVFRQRVPDHEREVAE